MGYALDEHCLPDLIQATEAESHGNAPI